MDPSALPSAVGVGPPRGEGDVPDAGLLAGVQHLDDVRVIGDLVTTQDHGLVFVEGDDVLQLHQQLVRGELLAVDDDLAVFFDVDDDLADVAGLLFLPFLGGGHADVHHLLLLGILEGHGEENDQQEQHIDQRRELQEMMDALLRDVPGWLYVPGMFLSNVLVGWIALEVARSYSRKEREKVEGPKQVVEAQH